MEGHGLVDGGFEGEFGEIFAAIGVKRPVEPIDQADDEEIVDGHGDERDEQDVDVVGDVEIAGRKLADDAGSAVGNQNVINKDVDGDQNE